MKTLFYNQTRLIPDDIKAKMISLVNEVYDADSAQIFADELIKFPYQIVAFSDDKKETIISLGCFMESALDFDTYCLCWGMVKPEYQWQGIGKALNEERIKRIIELGATKILTVTKKPWHLMHNDFKIIHTYSDGELLMLYETNLSTC